MDTTPQALWAQFAQAALGAAISLPGTESPGQAATYAAHIADIMMDQVKQRFIWDSTQQRWLNKMKQAKAGE